MISFNFSKFLHIHSYLEISAILDYYNLSEPLIIILRLRVYGKKSSMANWVHKDFSYLLSEIIQLSFKKQMLINDQHFDFAANFNSHFCLLHQLNKFFRVELDYWESINIKAHYYNLNSCFDCLEINSLAMIITFKI